MVRQYLQHNPSHPLEPAGSTAQGAGVQRHVVYLADGAKLVTWDFTNDEHGEEWE